MGATDDIVLGDTVSTLLSTPGASPTTTESAKVVFENNAANTNAAITQFIPLLCIAKYPPKSLN